MKNLVHVRWALLGLVLLVNVGCVTRGYPTHGGGKRFFREQQVVSAAINGALGQLDLSQLSECKPKDKAVPLQVFSMSHSGGGVQNGSGIGVGGLLGGLLGFGTAAAFANGGSPAAAYPAAVAAGSAAPGGYSTYLVESADDLKYLTGALVRELGNLGYAVKQPKAGASGGVLTILVSELGIDQNDLNLIVYGEKRLKARAVMEAFWVNHNADSGTTTYHSLGRGGATSTFSEDFFLGFGPLSGEVVETTLDGEEMP